MSRKKRKAKPFNESDFCAWMDGYCEAFDDFSDGAWQAACEGAVEEFNNEYGTRIDPNEGLHIWLRARN
jgi:hypothetical protein